MELILPSVIQYQTADEFPRVGQALVTHRHSLNVYARATVAATNYLLSLARLLLGWPLSGSTGWARPQPEGPKESQLTVVHDLPSLGGIRNGSITTTHCF